MRFEGLLNHYEEEPFSSFSPDRSFGSIDPSEGHSSDDTHLCFVATIKSERTEIYGRKIKKCLINISNDDILPDDITKIQHIIIPVDFLVLVVSRIELDVRGQALFWMERDMLEILLDHAFKNNQTSIDILQPFMDFIPLHALKDSQVELIFNVKSEFLESSACIKVEHQHKLFRYHNFDAEYERDFGYDERAFENIKTIEYLIDTPELTIYGERSTKQESYTSVPVSQLYQLPNIIDSKKIIFKNAHIIGISSQLLFISTCDDIDLCTVPFRVMSDRGVVESVFLKHHESLSRAFILDMPERKCNLRDETLLFICDGMPSNHMIKTVYAVFTNSFQTYKHLGNVTFLIHQKTK